MKKYIRKTEDEYEVLALYGKNWEVVTTEKTHKEMRERLKEYRENEPQFLYTWKRKRVPIVAPAAN